MLTFSFSSLFTDAFTIMTSIFNWITDNPLLLGMLGLTVVIPTVFTLYQRFKR